MTDTNNTKSQTTLVSNDFQIRVKAPISVSREAIDEFTLLPHWAIGTTNGQLVEGAQLPTRDGRRAGNAHIVGLEVKQIGLHGAKVFYSVLTDAGTVMTLTGAEIAKLYYPPRWVCDVSEVLRKFSRRPIEPVVPKNINQRLSFKDGWKAAELAHRIEK